MSFTSLFERFSSPKPQGASPKKGHDISAEELIDDMNSSLYKTIATNWYTAKPYGFKMTLRSGDTFIFFLPIAPTNLIINTNFATNVVPTLYGTVEEHSDVRYFDITISGTTGMAPRYTKPGKGDKPAEASESLRQTGRESFPIAQGVALGGFFSKTLGVINQIKNKASDLISGAPRAQTGVFTEQTGYYAFHNFYKFLLHHKKDASGADGERGVRAGHPLTFFNYKDNNEYDVVVRNFVLTRSSDNPMLYNYQITLRGYNLRTVGDKIDEDLNQRLKDLGLNGIDSSSLLGDIKGIANSAKAIIGSAVAGINVLGR